MLNEDQLSWLFVHWAVRIFEQFWFFTLFIVTIFFFFEALFHPTIVNIRHLSPGNHHPGEEIFSLIWLVQQYRCFTMKILTLFVLKFECRGKNSDDGCYNLECERLRSGAPEHACRCFSRANFHLRRRTVWYNNNGIQGTTVHPSCRPQWARTICCWPSLGIITKWVNSLSTTLCWIWHTKRRVSHL